MLGYVRLAAGLGMPWLAGFMAIESNVFEIPLSWRGNILVIKDNHAAPGHLAKQLRQHLKIAPNTLIDNDFILLLDFPESAEP